MADTTKTFIELDNAVQKLLTAKADKRKWLIERTIKLIDRHQQSVLKQLEKMALMRIYLQRELRKI